MTVSFFFVVFFFYEHCYLLFQNMFLAVPWGSPCVLDASISGVEWSVCPCSLNIVIVVVFEVVNSLLVHVHY